MAASPLNNIVYMEWPEERISKGSLIFLGAPGAPKGARTRSTPIPVSNPTGLT